MNPISLADETYVTRHVTRGRLKRLSLMIMAQNGIDNLDAALDLCGDDNQRAKLLDALCLNWFGWIDPIQPRSDRGGTHRPPKRTWLAICEYCNGEFNASRPDARYCRNLPTSRIPPTPRDSAVTPGNGVGIAGTDRPDLAVVARRRFSWVFHRFAPRFVPCSVESDCYAAYFSKTAGQRPGNAHMCEFPIKTRRSDPQYGRPNGAPRCPKMEG